MGTASPYRIKRDHDIFLSVPVTGSGSRPNCVSEALEGRKGAGHGGRIESDDPAGPEGQAMAVPRPENLFQVGRRREEWAKGKEGLERGKEEGKGEGKEGSRDRQFTGTHRLTPLLQPPCSLLPSFLVTRLANWLAGH